MQEGIKRGEGIVWDASYPIYVANAIPMGIELKYKVIKNDKRRAFGKLVRLFRQVHKWSHCDACWSFGNIGWSQIRMHWGLNPILNLSVCHDSLMGLPCA